MKKKYLITSICVLLVLSICLYVFISNDTENVVISNESNKQLMNTNALTMMYETEANSGEYQIASDTTWPLEGYTFNAEMSSCEKGSTLTWDDENKRVLMEANTSDKCYVYFDKEPDIVYLADYIKGLYTADGENGLYLHDGTGSYTYANQEAGDNSYRFSGANPDNYVCFGATGETCQNEDNQYRIIGVFNNQVKLIKATSYGNYSWDVDNINTWDGNTKPDIYTTLNTTYYNTLGSEWQNLIAETTWQVGGMGTSNTNTAKQYYDEEVGTGQSGYDETMKIGLMYVSDFGYAISPEKWTTALYEENYGTDNWLYLDDYEWLLSRSADDTDFAFFVRSDYGGFVSYDLVYNAYAVRPSFYLQPWVLYSGGDGSESNPYRISAPENLISFTIGGITYYAEEGMTWGEWSESEWNILEVVCNINGTCSNSSSSIVYKTNDGSSSVNSSDAIIENGNYIFLHTGGTTTN